MANNLQMGTATRQAMIAAYITDVGVTPKLNFLSGAQPANCAAAASGSTLALLTLPSSWVTSAAGVTTIASGPWVGTGQTAGVIGYYRLNDSANTTCKEQGTCGTGTFDISLDNTTIAVGQTISITSWNRTQGGA